MAVGDGFQRLLLARLADGREEVVSFDEYDPQSMEPLTPTWRYGRPISSRTFFKVDGLVSFAGG